MDSITDNGWQSRQISAASPLGNASGEASPSGKTHGTANTTKASTNEMQADAAGNTVADPSAAAEYTAACA